MEKDRDVCVARCGHGDDYRIAVRLAILKKEGTVNGQGNMIVTITQKELMRLEMIMTDNDKDEALVFLKELRVKIEAGSIKGMKSHLDG